MMLKKIVKIFLLFNEYRSSNYSHEDGYYMDDYKTNGNFQGVLYNDVFFGCTDSTSEITPNPNTSSVTGSLYLNADYLTSNKTYNDEFSTFPYYDDYEKKVSKKLDPKINIKHNNKVTKVSNSEKLMTARNKNHCYKSIILKNKLKKRIEKYGDSTNLQKLMFFFNNFKKDSYKLITLFPELFVLLNKKIERGEAYEVIDSFINEARDRFSYYPFYNLMKAHQFYNYRNTFKDNLLTLIKNETGEIDPRYLLYKDLVELEKIILGNKKIMYNKSQSYLFRKIAYLNNIIFLLEDNQAMELSSYIRVLIKLKYFDIKWDFKDIIKFNTSDIQSLIHKILKLKEKYDEVLTINPKYFSYQESFNKFFRNYELNFKSNLSSQGVSYIIHELLEGFELYTKLFCECRLNNSIQEIKSYFLKKK